MINFAQDADYSLVQMKNEINLQYRTGKRIHCVSSEI